MDTELPRFRNTGEALEVLMSAMGFLADADYAQLPAADKADALRGLEQADAVEAVARAGLIWAFDAQDEFELDGQASMAAWLKHRTRITKDEAAGHRAWVRRRREHPVLMAAMRGGYLSKSWARKVMTVTGKIPEARRGEADTIIAAAARMGADLPGLIRLAAEILARTAGPDEDDRPFTDRHLRLQTTFDGAGVLAGELSPECAAAVRAVLDTLARRRGKDDIRSHGERLHDALEDAMLRLLGTGLLPGKGGHPVQAVVHVPFADLVTLDGGSVLQQQWGARVAAQWAGHRAAAAEQPGDGSAWINGPAARGITCDAALFPIVTGDVDLGPLDDLIRLCVELDSCLHARPGDTPDPDAHAAGTSRPAADRGAHAARIQDLMEQVIGTCAAIMSGEPGLASFLRRGLLGQAGLGGPSLPLDVGDVDDVPWWIRRAVDTRDQRCRWPAGCDAPAYECQAHHLVHRADHGPTKVDHLYDFCKFHHLIAIHKWGWTIRICGDGTLEATAPDGRVYKDHSRPPPPRPG